MPINYESCALCQHMLFNNKGECDTCPIFQTTGRVCQEEYDYALKTANPKPMLTLLTVVDFRYNSDKLKYKTSTNDS